MAELDERVVVLAPSAHDGPVTTDLLTKAGFDCVLTRSVDDLSRTVRAGAAVALVAEEALSEEAVAQPILDLLERQEPWSDLPVIVFRGKAGAERRALPPTLATVAAIGNVTFLDRPIRVITLVSAVRAAIRARRRQYGARTVVAELQRVLEDRERGEEALLLANQALREADRRKDEFLGMLSHELRNPLAPIRNSIYVLEHADGVSDQARRARTVINRQTEHLTRLVEDLLDVTRIASGKIELRRSVMDLREVVWRAADDFRLVLDERGVGFRATQPDGPVWAEIDTTRITQVIGNLLHNAAKFTRRGDEVTLALRLDGDSAEIGVRDSGAGIDPDLLPRIFEAFVQGERTLARTDGGLGLGLALVKGIAELHGGSVRAESDGKGRGAEFTVRLPLSAPPAAASPPEARFDRRHLAKPSDPEEIRRPLGDQES